MIKMKYFEKQLAKIYQTKEEYIEECKKCFLKQNKIIQEEIENASIEDLEYELKLTMFGDYKKAIKYEIMLRNDFKVEI